MPKVSVIIPAYNSEKHLGLALDSATGQTFKDIEIIIIDDGSADRTAEIIRGRIKKNNDIAIRYFYQRNQGPAAARNLGLRESLGEYIAFLDADDIWLPQKLEKQVARLDGDSAIGFVYCDNFFVDVNGQLIDNYIRKVKFVRGDILLDFFCDHFLMTPAVIMRRICLDKVGFFDESLKVGEDYSYFLRLAKHYRADYVAEKLWKRVVRMDSTSRQDFILDANTDLRTLTEFIKKNPDFYLQNVRTVNQRLGDYYFSFAYHLLEKGYNLLAFKNLMQALQYNVSLRIFKNLLFCLIPLKLRKFLQSSFLGRNFSKKIF